MFFQFNSHANSTHGNVVRVAPRPKTIQPPPPPSSASSSSPMANTTTTPTFCYNLAQSFQSSSSNFHPNKSAIASSIASSAAAAATPNKFRQQQSSIGNDISFMSLDNSAATVCSEISLKSSASSAYNNPFLAKRPQSLNQLKCDRYLIKRQQPPPPPPPPTTLQQQQRPIAVASSLSLKSSQSIKSDSTAPQALALCTAMSHDKKFNSLKSNTNARNTLQFYSLRLNKCKRHQQSHHTNSQNHNQSLQQKLLVIDNNAIKTNALPYQKTIDTYHNNRQLYHYPTDREKASAATTIGQLINLHEQPLYENLVNSTLEQSDSTQLAAVLDEFYNEATDGNSIYRSDSGISNSSYECVTPNPIPAPRNNPRNCQSAPVYVNLPKSSMVRGVSVLLSNRNRRRATSINTGAKYSHNKNKMDVVSPAGSTCTTAYNYEVWPF